MYFFSPSEGLKLKCVSPLINDKSCFFFLAAAAIDCWVCNSDSDPTNCGETINELALQDAKSTASNCAACGKYFKSLGTGTARSLQLGRPSVSSQVICMSICSLFSLSLSLSLSLCVFNLCLGLCFRINFSYLLLSSHLRQPRVTIRFSSLSLERKEKRIVTLGQRRCCHL